MVVDGLYVAINIQCSLAITSRSVIMKVNLTTNITVFRDGINWHTYHTDWMVTTHFAESRSGGVSDYGKPSPSKFLNLVNRKNILNLETGAAILFIERRPPIKSRSISAAYRPFKNARDQIWICQI